MTKKTSLFVLFLGIILSLGLCALAPSTRTSAAGTFDPTSIIDDGIFYNYSSMTAQQIQAFLDSKVPSCDSNGTQSYNGTTRGAWANSHGQRTPFTCLKNYYENPSSHANNFYGGAIPNGAISAAQIIYNVAQQYSINPQVLIVTLQKEQGLVTDDWPWDYQYRTAMGYGCPDTAPCDTAYYGFYNQVSNAAWQFRQYATNPNSYNYVPGPGNYVRFNPNASCGGTTLNIQNQATASLYDYTPYQPNASALAAGYGSGDSCGAYGNRNFWLYFNDWFGSTKFPQPLGGSLLYQTSTGKIYLTTGSSRYYISSWSMMTNYGLDAFPMQPVSDATIQQYGDGGTLTNLVWDSGGVYLVNNKVRYHVSSDMCTAWGLSCMDNTAVKGLGSSFQTQYLQTGGELTQLASSAGVTYEMSGGKKLPIANEASLKALGLDKTATLATSSVNSSQPLGQLLMTTPGAASFSPSQAIYYYDGVSYFGLPSMDSYNDWNIGKLPQLSVPTSSYNKDGPPPSPNLSAWYQDASSNKYIIDQGRKILIPTALQGAWSGVSFTSQPQSLVDALPSATLQTFAWGNGVYQISGGKKHHVPTWSSYLALGITDAQTTVLRPDKLSPIPLGNDALGDSTLVALQGDSQGVYVVNNGKITHIPDLSTFNDYGFSWNAILTYPDSILDDYPLAAASLSSGVINNTYYVAGVDRMYQLSGSLATDFGALNSQFQNISPQLVKGIHPVSISRFLYNSNTGRIYYASGGAIHYVATYSAFVAYGGKNSPISVINNSSMSLFTEAQAVY